MTDSPWLFAAGIALGLFGLLIAWAWATRGPDDGAAKACLRLILRLYTRAWHGLRWSPAADPLPARGAAIVVANHRSGVDPLVLYATTRRDIHFLMAREYYEVPHLRWLFRLVGAIPVNRDGKDLSATKAALQRLKEGRVVGIFPEGGIRAPGEEGMDGSKFGVALLALRTGAAVVPAHITGTPPFDSVLRAFVSPSRSSIRFGEPLRFARAGERKPGREEMETITKTIFERIETLRRESEGRDTEDDSGRSQATATVESAQPNDR